MVTFDLAWVAEEVLVVCLCAQWCHVCEDYRSRFAQVQQNVRADFPRIRFLWMDVEDEADLLEPLDVQDFPTVLLAVGGRPRFFGPVVPRVLTLERLVRDAGLAREVIELSDPELRAVVARILAAKPETNKRGQIA